MHDPRLVPVLGPTPNTLSEVLGLPLLPALDLAPLPVDVLNEVTLAVGNLPAGILNEVGFNAQTRDPGPASV